MEIPQNANALDYYALMNITRNLNIDEHTRQISKIRTIFFILYILAYFYRQPYTKLKEGAVQGVYLPQGIFELIEFMILILIMLLKGYQVYRLESNQKVNQDQILKQKICYAFFSILGIFMICIDFYFLINYQHQYLAYINSLIRPVLIILQSRPLQLIIKNYITVIIESYEILIVLVFNILVFAAIGKLTFYNDDHFSTSNIFLMFIALLSNGESPDVIFYKENKYSAIYFISFQMINTLILFNFIISNFYCQYELVFKRKFESYAQEVKKNASIQFNTRHNARIRIASSIIGSLVVKKLLDQIIKSKYLKQTINFLHLLDFILIFFFSYKTFINSGLFHYINLCLNGIIIIEQLIKLLFYVQKYYSSVNNKKTNLTRIFIQMLNIIITICIITLTILHLNQNQNSQTFIQFLGYLMISRLLRPTKFYLKSKYIDFLLLFFKEIGPYLLEFFGIIILYMNVYSTIGQFMFNNCEEFQKFDLNFNDNLQSMVTTWHLLIFSSWKEIKDQAISCSDHSQWYFVTYYVFVNILSFNVTLALLINYMVLKWRSFKLETLNQN